MTIEISAYGLTTTHQINRYGGIDDRTGRLTMDDWIYTLIERALEAGQRHGHVVHDAYTATWCVGERPRGQ